MPNFGLVWRESKHTSVLVTDVFEMHRVFHACLVCSLPVQRRKRVVESLVELLQVCGVVDSLISILRPDLLQLRLLLMRIKVPIVLLLKRRRHFPLSILGVLSLRNLAESAVLWNNVVLDRFWKFRLQGSYRESPRLLPIVGLL